MRLLSIFSLVYILLPSFIFLASWVSRPVSILAIGLIMIAFFYATRKIRFDGLDNHGNLYVLNRSLIIRSGGFSLVLCLISEFGLSPYQSYDYMAHNYKFNLLACQELPLFDVEKGIYACYYFGFYIVPSMFGKIFGLASIQYFSFIWIWIGLWLSFIWINIRLEFESIKPIYSKYGIWILLILTGSFVNSILPLYDFFIHDDFVSNNAVDLTNNFVLNQVPVFTRNLSESTQHSIPAILGISIFLVIFKNRDSAFYGILFLLGTLFWSPFSTIGLFLFVLLKILKQLFDKPSRIYSIVAFSLISLLGFLPIIIFFLSSNSTSMASNKFIWQVDIASWPFYYALYVFSFIGVWFFLLGRKIFFFDKEALIVSVVIFLVLGLVQMGHYNDLNIRASIPAQIVLGLSVILVLMRDFELLTIRFLIVLVFFVVNSFSVWKFYYERFFVLSDGQKMNTIESPVVPEYGNNFFDFMRNAYSENGEEVVKQYSLRKGSLFEKYLLKKEKIVGEL